MKKLGSLKNKIDTKNSDVKINLAAIIDCMVVILAYLLLSGSFLSLGVIETNLSETSEAKVVSSGGDQKEVSEENLNNNLEILIVDLDEENQIKITSSVLEFPEMEIPALGEKKIDYDTFLRGLKAAKENYPSIKMVSFRPHRALFYKDFIKTLETTKVFYSDVWMDQ